MMNHPTTSTHDDIAAIQTFARGIAAYSAELTADVDDLDDAEHNDACLACIRAGLMTMLEIIDRAALVTH